MISTNTYQCPTCAGEGEHDDHRYMLASEVACYLEYLAKMVRVGHLTAVSFEWDGGTVINAKIKPLAPLEFIKIDLTV
jgi:hypothetical protein